jgi:hypothetical protein
MSPDTICPIFLISVFKVPPAPLAPLPSGERAG